MEMSDDGRPTAMNSVLDESIEIATEPQVNERDEEKDESSSFFPIGTVVDVMPRLWPGINKPGGVGRVYGVHYDEEEDCYLYDVQYIVVSGKEDRIEERFVKLHVEETGHRSVRGRCKLCGSFIRDCQHTAADIAEHYRKLREAAEEKRLGLKKKKDVTIAKPNVDETGEPSKGSSLSSKAASGSVPHKRSKLHESTAADGHVSGSSSEGHSASSSSEYNDDDSGSSNDEDLTEETMAVNKQQSASASSVSDELSALTNEAAKEKARSLHRQLYNTCLQGDATEDNVFINNSRNDDTNYLSVEYREAVQSLKTLTLGECMELLRLCHNFIINMRLRAVSPTGSRSATLEQQRHQLSMDLSAVTSDLRQQQDEDHRLELAERVVTLDEKQEKLFRQIERAGFDIFNKAEKRARGLLKVSVFKKPLKRQIMTLSLAVSVISSSWAEEMKKARVEMIDIADTFADLFGRYAEDVIDGIDASDGDTSEDPDDDHDHDHDRTAVKPLTTAPRLPLPADRLRDPAQEAGIKRPRPPSDGDSDDEDFEFPRRPTQVPKKAPQRRQPQQRQRKLSASAARWQQRRARLGYGRSLSDDADEHSGDDTMEGNTVDLTGDRASDGRPSSRSTASKGAKKASSAGSTQRSVKIFRRKESPSSSSSSSTKPAAVAWTFDQRMSDSALVRTNAALTRRRQRSHRYASFRPSNRSTARATSISKRSSSSFIDDDDAHMDVDDPTTGNDWASSAIIAWDSDDEQGTVADLSNQLRAHKQRQRRNQQRQNSSSRPSGRASNGSGNNRSTANDRVQDDDYVNLLHQPSSTAKSQGSKKPSIRKSCYFRTSADAAVDPTISYDGRIVVLENDQYVGNVVNLNVPIPHRSVVSERIADRLLSCYDLPANRLDHGLDTVSDLDEDEDNDTEETTAAGFNAHRGGGGGGGGSVSISSYIQQYLARYDSSGRDSASTVMAPTPSTVDKQHMYINFLFDCYTQATAATRQRSSSSLSGGQDDVRGIFRKIVVRNVVWQLHSCVAQATVFRLEEERLQSQLDQVASSSQQRSSLMTSMVPVFAAQVHEWERQLRSLASFIPAILFSDLQPMFLKTRATAATEESIVALEAVQWLHLFLSTSEIEQEISHALLPLLPTHQLAHERSATFPPTIRWIDTLLAIVELNKTVSSSSSSSSWSLDKYAQALYRLACPLLTTLLRWKLTLIQKLVALLLSSPSYQATPTTNSSGTSGTSSASATAPGHEPVDKQLAQAIKQSFVDLFQVVVFLVYRLLRSPALSLHLLPLMTQRDLLSSSSSSTSTGPTFSAAESTLDDAQGQAVVVNFPLELLLSALHHFGHAQTSLATLKLPAENELTKMITCRWWEIVQTIVLAGDSAWTMTSSQLPSLFWQRLLWQRLSFQGGFQSIPPGHLPSSVSSLAQKLPAAWTLWTNPECLWAMLAVLTKYQRLRLQQSRCTNHWALVHCLCKWNVRVLASSADTNVAPKPLLLKGLLRNIHRLAAIALYWDAGNEALLLFLDLVPQLAALLNKLDTLHITTTAAAAANNEAQPTASNGRAAAPSGLTAKKTSGYSSSSSGGVLAALLQQQQQQQRSSASDAGDRHFRWMQLTPRVSLLLADHWQRELAQKRRGTMAHGQQQQQPPASSFTWQQARSSLHRYLLQLVALTFVSYRMPHPLGPLCDALLVAPSHRRQDPDESTATGATAAAAAACDWSVFLRDDPNDDAASSNASLHATNTTTTLSLWTIESLRMSLKLLLRNITTTVDIATGHHSLSTPLLQRIANFFAPAATVDRWLSIFMAHPHFMSGNLLCLLTKELESGLSMPHVRTRMGLSTKLIDAFIATPLQPMVGADYATVASDLSFTAEDRQRSCLMFFASLLVFNPFPIPTTRLSSAATAATKPSSTSSTTTTTMEWMVNMSREDTTSLAPFLNLVQLVQTMCMHSVLDHGRVTEEVEVLLLASMNISNVVIHHLDLCYVPVVHSSTMAAAETTTTSSAPSAAAPESLLRSFPDTIFQVSLQLFNTMMQLTTATDTIKMRSKRNVMELSAFAVLFVTSWMRGVHHYLAYLHQEDPTVPGVATMAATELSKIASLYATVILQQVQSKVKTLVMSLLRKCRETLETFSVVPADVTATTRGAHKRQHGHPSSTSSNSAATSPSVDTFLYPERLDQLQENASYVFAVSTAKIMVPAVELLGQAVHVGWSLTHAGVLPPSSASIADSLWQSWYESIDLSLLAGTDMCVGFWMKALLWRQMAQQVASLQQQLTQQCPPHLTAVMATDPRYHYARVRQQQIHHTLGSYRRVFVQHLHDILLCLLALEAMPAVKTTMVLETNAESLMKAIVQALQTLNLLTVEAAMPSMTRQWSLHPHCFSRHVPAGATVTLGPIHVLVLSTLAHCRSAVEASVSSPLGPLPLLHECIQQLLKMKASPTAAAATAGGANGAAQGLAGSSLPSNFADHLVQHVYLRVLRFLNLCRFQASEGSMRDIDGAVVAVHQPLAQLISFAENRCLPGDMRVALVTISLYFSDFVHPYVKHGLTLLKATQLPAQRLGATTSAKSTRTNEAIDTLPRWQHLLTAELPSLLPSWILLAMSVPFATRCKEWSVLLEVLMVVYHPRMKGLIPFRAGVLEAFLVEIQALLHEPSTEPLDEYVQAVVIAGTRVSKLHRFDGPLDLTALVVAARQFVGFVFDGQCPFWFRTILSLERSLYENEYDLLRLSEPQVQEVIGQIVQEVRQALPSNAT